MDKPITITAYRRTITDAIAALCAVADVLCTEDQDKAEARAAAEELAEALREAEERADG